MKNTQLIKLNRWGARIPAWRALNHVADIHSRSHAHMPGQRIYVHRADSAMLSLYAVLLIVLKKHGGDVPYHIREFHILMWDYKNGRYRRKILGANGRFIVVPAMWLIFTCTLRPRL